jgi:hypothetical protein
MQKTLMSSIKSVGIQVKLNLRERVSMESRRLSEQQDLASLPSWEGTAVTHRGWPLHPSVQRCRRCQRDQ